MSHSALRYALGLSVLLNLGVIGAVGYQAAQRGALPAVVSAEPSTPDHLKLTPDQRQRWHALEADFIREFQSDMKEIAGRRERLVREIFSERPSEERIEAEREAIARLQAQQQKRVIAQLLREREILEPSQQQALAALLLTETPAETAIERLHRSR